MGVQVSVWVQVSVGTGECVGAGECVWVQVMHEQLVRSVCVQVQVVHITLVWSNVFECVVCVVFFWNRFIILFYTGCAT